MSDVAVHVDLRDVEKGIDAMANPSAIEAGLRAVKRPLREDQRAHAIRNEGPEGRWPARKAKSRRRLLGRLPTAVRIYAGRASVSAVSSVRWSAAHQEGATVGHGVKLPARPFLWASDGLRTTAAEYLRAAVLERW